MGEIRIRQFPAVYVLAFYLWVLNIGNDFGLAKQNTGKVYPFKNVTIPSQRKGVVQHFGKYVCTLSG